MAQSVPGKWIQNRKVERKASLLPREHGAWAMLLQPFAGALIVLHHLTWAVVPASSAVVLIFVLREPLTVLARQKWTWKTQRPETHEARIYLAFELAGLAASGILLFLVWPIQLLAILGGGAAILTLLAVYMTLKNRQRSVWLQALSAAGLSSSALAACLAVSGTIPPWCWWLWGLHSAHFFAGILVVHVRLEARIAARKGASIFTAAYLSIRREAMFVQVMILAVSVWLLAGGRILFGAALLLSAAVHIWDVIHVHTARALALPMASVGKRALAVSIAFTTITILGSLL